LKKQEDEFKAKRGNIMNMQKENEVQEFEKSQKLLSEITDKINTSMQNEQILLESTKK